MSPLPAWMRAALFATAAMNIGGSAAFIPAAGALRKIGGLPDGGHPLYIATVGVFILVFGLAYLRCAITGRADRLFISVGAAGKLAFFALLLGYYFAGDLPLSAPLSGGGDLIFAALFFVWLARGDPAASTIG